MGVRSKRLASRVQLTPASTAVTLYTTSSGETALIKRVIVHNPHTAAVTVYIGVAGIAPNSSGIYRKVVVPADDSADFDTWWVIPDGNSLSGYCATNTVRVSLFGAELEGVAD